MQQENKHESEATMTEPLKCIVKGMPANSSYTRYFRHNLFRQPFVFPPLDKLVNQCKESETR